MCSVSARVRFGKNSSMPAKVFFQRPFENPKKARALVAGSFIYGLL